MLLRKGGWRLLMAAGGTFGPFTSQMVLAARARRPEGANLPGIATTGASMSGASGARESACASSTTISTSAFTTFTTVLTTVKGNVLQPGMQVARATSNPRRLRAALFHSGNAAAAAFYFLYTPLESEEQWHQCLLRSFDIRSSATGN